MLVLSLGIHTGLAVFGIAGAARQASIAVVEFDLTQPVRPAGPIAEKTKPAIQTTPQAPERSWTLPSPGGTAPLPSPENASASFHEPDGSGVQGQFEGSAAGGLVSRLSRLPRLLNGAKLKGHMRRFYPESERQKGNSGKVVVDLVIDEKGAVRDCQVVQASAPAFGEAARHVVGLLRFAPAYAGNRPVTVKVRQNFIFKMER
jgi:TonB family protein